MTPSFAVSAPCVQRDPPHETGCDPRDGHPLHVGGSMYRVDVAGPCAGRMTFMLLADAIEAGVVGVVHG